MFQLLEVVRLEGHSLAQEDAFVSRDIHLLQVLFLILLSYLYCYSFRMSKFHWWSLKSYIYIYIYFVLFYVSIKLKDPALLSVCNHGFEWLVLFWQICSGVDENAVGACSELVFAPIDEMFPDDAPLLPSGFRIIPLDSKTVEFVVLHLSSIQLIFLLCLSS